MEKIEPKNLDDLRPEYERSDFDELIIGKYAAQLSEETNVVVLEPDVAKTFPNEKAVNEALRALLKLMETTHLTMASSRLY
jgi:hypothetical protein